MRWAPTGEIVVPSSPRARATANIAALRELAVIHTEDRFATPAEQDVIARWSGWGAVPQIFDLTKQEFADLRSELEELLTDEEWNSARSTTLNAHYTDPEIVQAMWDALGDAGFTGGRVLEPGCGSGNFIGAAPESAQMVGVELDPVSAAVAAALYPSAQIRAEAFEDTTVPDGAFVAAIGNVPFAQYRPHDPAHNRQRLSLHNYVIAKSLALTAPGGYVAVVTSAWTADAAANQARKAFAERADLISAVRLPENAFQRVAGTSVVTDILVLRVRKQGQPMSPVTEEFLRTSVAPVAGGSARVNAYYQARPEHVLGELELTTSRFASETLTVRADPARPMAAAVREILAADIRAARDAGLGLTATAADTVPDAALVGDLTTPATPGVLRYSDTDRRIERWSGTAWEHATTIRGASAIAEHRDLLRLRDIHAALIANMREDGDLAVRRALRGELNDAYDAYAAAHGPINRFTESVSPVTMTPELERKQFEALENEWRIDNGVGGQPYTGPIPNAVLDVLAEKAAIPDERITRRQQHLSVAIRQDPTFSTVMALEVFDEESQLAAKAAVFTTDVLRPARVIDHAETLPEAAAIALTSAGHVDTAVVARLLDLEVAEVERRLPDEQVAFRSHHSPSTWIPAASYLSGNVRVKAAEAADRAGVDDRYLPGARALAAVIPERVTTGITVRLGAAWIPTEYYVAFAREQFGIDASFDLRVASAAGRWVVEGPKSWRMAPTANMEWGLVPRDGYGEFNFRAADPRLARLPRQGVPRDVKRAHTALGVLASAMNQTAPKVRYSAVAEGEGFTGEYTEASRFLGRKAEQLHTAFEAWLLHSDDQRREAILDVYNEVFNAHVAGRYDGTHLELPGLGTNFAPYPYQRNAVARALAEPSVLLNHVVGAGKTGTMLMIAMELRRLGLARQPWMVVPNHIAAQIVREAAQWYPGARVLSGATRSTPEERQLLVAQAAAQEWDLVVVPTSAFKLIGVRPDTQAQYLDEELNAMRTELDAMRLAGVSDKSVKEIEQAIKNLQQKLDDHLDPNQKDVGLTFEDTGCDYLLVDEAHQYKNLSRFTNVTDLQVTGADQATDLDMKLRYLREQKTAAAAAAGLSGDAVVPRIATFATGTPISNNLSEIWVMTRYLRPDLLDEAGVSSLNSWAATFADQVTDVEIAPSGSGLRSKTRVSMYRNVAELTAQVSMYMDVVGRDQITAKLPAKVGGAPEAGGNIVVEFASSTEVQDFIADLGTRALAASTGDPHVDNVLKIMGDGRNVALDPRAANMPPEPGIRTRAEVLAEQVLEQWHATRDMQVRLPSGEPSTRPGGFQIVFCDRGVPSPGRLWSMYEQIRSHLVAGGMDPRRVRFIHDADTSAKKTRLFSACNAGEVDVLIGNTAKMGTGANMQVRAVALHHVDVPWTPADLEQREGRIIRQGNQSPEVKVYNYVQTGTSDAFSWQTLFRKARMIEQFYTADRRQRSMDALDTESGADAAAYLKAMATGDPRYVTVENLKKEVGELDAAKHAAEVEVASRGYERESLRRSLPDARTRLGRLDHLITAAADWLALENPRYQIAGYDGAYDTYSVRADASRALGHRIGQILSERRGDETAVYPVATLGEVEIAGRYSAHLNAAVLRVVGAAEAAITLRADEIATEPGRLGSGVLTRMRNTLAALPEARGRLTSRIELDSARLDVLATAEAQPFDTTELDRKRAELDSLQKALRAVETSEAAKQRAAERAARMEDMGRLPGWTLRLNPTPAVAEANGFDTREDMAASVRADEDTLRAALADNRRLSPDDRDVITEILTEYASPQLPGSGAATAEPPPVSAATGAEPPNPDVLDL